MMNRFGLWVATAIFLTPATSAIVVRHDVADAAYRKRAGNYPMVCSVGGGMGTLVSPTWLLTAGHVAEGAGGHAVRCGTAEVEIGEVHIHPAYATEQHRDLGLIRLKQAVGSVEPARLYRRQDEQDRKVQFVGDGQTGNGRTGPTVEDSIRRVADNTVSGVRPGWISFLFDAPPEGDRLEGISGPGDSGGPAFIEVDGRPHIAGVSAYNEGKKLCRYGSREHYARVSDELAWIEGVMSGEISSAANPRLMKYEKSESGQTQATRLEIKEVPVPESANTQLRAAVETLAGAMNDGSVAARDGTMSMFEPTYLRRREKAGDPVTDMLDFLREAIQVRGPIARFHELPSSGIEVPDSRYPMRPVIFHLKDGTPGYFGVALNEEGLIDHLSLFLQAGICREQAACKLGKPF